MNLDPRIYFATFDLNPDGKKVIEDLCRVFYDRPSYVKGDTHETAFNEGAKSVINFILNKMAKAMDSQPLQQEEDE